MFGADPVKTGGVRGEALGALGGALEVVISDGQLQLQLQMQRHVRIVVQILLARAPDVDGALRPQRQVSQRLRHPVRHLFAEHKDTVTDSCKKPR